VVQEENRGQGGLGREDHSYKLEIIINTLDGGYYARYSNANAKRVNCTKC
jgi:hypothetical protein